ncbi:site-specific DNA-methyltransferase [Kocuria sp. ICS0012]|uniref:site-specific DNA-methyltransferase n=1 Tax=Kocuria sp. ICS0012 TaxID=1834155 RepID=UPI0007EBCA76|nr:DNA methyltransferase [Kocuria sp. ICS0012]OBA48740.1 DNA methyltransferase [Kocuria sp. ICS0012]
MSKLTDLLRQVERKDPQLAADLDREYKALSSRRAFGLNFERHHPESIEIPGRKVRKGEKVRILPPRSSLKATDKTLWVVECIERVDGGHVAHLTEHDAHNPETRIVNVDDLVVVAVFRDFIYPGLASIGKVERSEGKPFHTFIKGENFHVLESLTYTHMGKIDVIYIDPPYNTGAKDWKYNNDYVEGDDLYRHSRWLAFMERRLLIAKELMNPEDSTLIVTIDEKEYLRLGLLLEQIFPEARIQMVSSVINPAGSTRTGAFARTDEYVFFVLIGDARPTPAALSDEWRLNPSDKRTTKMLWAMLKRNGTGNKRADRPSMFYPIFVSTDGQRIVSVGDSLSLETSRNSIHPPEGTVACFPINSDGSEGRWQIGQDNLREIIAEGFVRIGRPNEHGFTLSYLKAGEQRKVRQGIYEITGRRNDGSVISETSVQEFIPGTAWRVPSHDSSRHGSNLLKALMPDRKFPFPKSLYAVEDALRFFVQDKPNATVLDFFAGSGTTAHAVMRLNRQDGGRRQCISITNNEVAAEEQKELRKAGLRPGDPEWEQRGICDYITKPRIEAAITGSTSLGTPIKGDYRFVDEFPMSKGIDENAQFFALTYETRTQVSHHKAFRQIAPLLWLRAGAYGACIETEPESGWKLAEVYGVLVDLDTSTAFVEAVKAASGIGMAYIVTDDERRFQAVSRRLPEGVEAVRLYESYLRNFQFRNGV